MTNQITSMWLPIVVLNAMYVQCYQWTCALKCCYNWNLVRYLCVACWDCCMLGRAEYAVAECSLL